MKSLRHSFPLITAISAGSCLLTAMSMAQSTAPEPTQRELDIMQNIFSASLEDRGSHRHTMGPPESLYLAGQGMLFIFNMPGGNFFSNNGNFFNGGDFNFDFDFDGTVDINGDEPGHPVVKLTSSGNKNANNPDNDLRRKLTDLNATMRDKQEDMRDLQRKLRDLQRAQRSDPAKANQTEMDRVTKSMESLGDEMSKMGNDISKAQQDYQSKRNAEAEAQHSKQVAVLFDTLCKYGNTLQSLKANEHVNLVLRNYTGNKTQVYVVDAAKLKGCSAGDKLLQDAKSYSM